MGVWHFMSLGESPGAVTSALAHIKRKFEKNVVAFFGGDSNRDKVKKVSGIIIFTTPEVRQGQRPIGKRVCIDNRYGMGQGKEVFYGNESDLSSAFDIVHQFINSEFQEMLSAERGKVFWLAANYHNLDFNLRQVARAFYALSPPGKTGKEVWVNLTGGSNVMNLAALLATALSGITGRAYYTYTQDMRLLRPANEADFWYDVPVLKVNFDRDYEAILKALDTEGGWLESDELLARVRQQRWQFSASKETFASNYLNKLDGWLVEREGNRNRLLQPAGRRFLDLINDDLIRALIYKEPLSRPPGLADILEEVT